MPLRNLRGNRESLFQAGIADISQGCASTLLNQGGENGTLHVLLAFHSVATGTGKLVFIGECLNVKLTRNLSLIHLLKLNGAFI